MRTTTKRLFALCLSIGLATGCAGPATTEAGSDATVQPGEPDGAEAQGGDIASEDGGAGGDATGADGVQTGVGSDADAQDGPTEGDAPGADAVEPSEPCVVDADCADDGNPCTDAACVDDACVHGFNAAPCDDSDACTTGDLCADGVCAGEALVCSDDGDPCTDAVCQAGECTHPFNSAACDDGDPCTQGDLCVEGLCAGVAMACMDDGNPCTEQTCTAGECVASPLEGLCDDGDLCTQGDACVEGACVGEPRVCEDDGDPCTDTVCVDGQCDYPFNEAPCDDGEPCTDGDVCSAGTCAGTYTACEDDGNPCTDVVCIGGDCVASMLTGPCDDGDLCTVDGVCDFGVCVSQAIVCEPDIDPCTDTVCAEGECIHAFNTAPCDDGNPCTFDDACAEGKCTGAMKPCPDDGNPCTHALCLNGACTSLSKSGPCDDGDPCTLTDTCTGGLCAGEPLVCPEDSDLCTDATCVDGACTQAFNNAPCDDGEPCTGEDACVEGFCVGSPKDCDDGNPCTKGLCDEAGDCYDVLYAAEPQCELTVVVDTPTRASTIVASGGGVGLSGHVNSLAGELTSFELNGVPLAVDEDGGFATTIAAEIGVNLVELVAYNVWGQRGAVAQTFLYGDAFHAPGSLGSPTAISGGIGIWASNSFFDDGNSDLDDIATFVELAMAQFDLTAAVPHQLKTSGGSNPSAGPCEYEVTTGNVSASLGSVSLNPVHGGLQVHISFVNLYSDVDFSTGQFLCPEPSGDVSINSINVTATLNFQVNNGSVSTSLGSVDASVHGLDVDIDGLYGVLFNFIVDFFEDDFAEEVESSIESEIPGVLVPMMSGILTDLGTYSSSFDISPGVPMQVATGLQGARFLPGGLDLTMSFGAGVDKQISADSPGSLAWTGCSAGSPVSGAAFGTAEGTVGTGTAVLPHASSHEAYFREDIANQLMFAAWWGGAAAVPVPVADEAEAGLDNVVASVELLLPPVVTGCTDNGKLEIQLGDLKMLTTFDFLGTPGVFEAYLSAWLEVQLTVVDIPGTGPGLGVGGMGLVAVVLDFVSSDGLPILTPEILETIFGQAVSEAVAGDFLDAALQAYPIPSVGVGGVAPGVPAGASLKLTPNTFTVSQGHLVFGGDLGIQ